MRLGVIDVGSNTVHLLVVDAHHGAAPTAALSRKWDLRLVDEIQSDGSMTHHGIERLEDALHQSQVEMTKLGCEDTLAFATSAIREATNGEAVLKQVREATGIDLEILDGEHEAILTFLAVRRWYGWSAGHLLVIDIGGGSLEVAAGRDESPAFARSMPLGAMRLTRDFLTKDPPAKSEVKDMRKHARKLITQELSELLTYGQPEHVVATSKTLKQLARICGAAPSSQGPRVKRILSAAALDDWTPRLARMSSRARSELPGVSAGRAEQLLAGAVVVQELMELLGVTEFEICPWALREGLILRRLDWYPEED